MVRYRLEDLGDLSAGVPLLPLGLGPHGEALVYGHSTERLAKTGRVRAFLRREGQLTELASAEGGLPVTAMSANGLCCGQRRGAGGVMQAWASHRGDFGAEFWPSAESAATGVNNVGEIAGHVALVSGGQIKRRVFLFHGDEPRLMPIPDGAGASAMAVALNDSGTVLANFSCGPFDSQTQAVLWWGESMTLLKAEAGGSLWATALTPGGRVCGRLLTRDGNVHAFLHEAGRIFDLNRDEICQSEALAANDRRVVVGRMMDDAGQRVAFRWTPADGMRPLAELLELAPGWSLQKAVAVDAAGVIAGTGLRDGMLRGFLLVPVSN